MRYCRDLAVLEHHLQRTRHRDAHDLSAHNTITTRRARARVVRSDEGVTDDDDVADSMCDVCGKPLELDAGVRANHLAAHDESGRVWCAVCKKSFGGRNESSIVRHENTSAHTRAWNEQVRATAGPLPSSAPSATAKRRLEATAHLYGKQRRVDEHIVATDDADDGFGAGDGFDGDAGADSADADDDVNDDVLDANAPPDPLPQSALPVLSVPIAVAPGNEAGDLDRDSESETDEDEDDVEQQQADTQVIARRAIMQHCVPPLDKNDEPFVVPPAGSDRVVALASTDNSAGACTDLTYMLIGIMNRHGLSREPCRQIFKVLSDQVGNRVAATYESACVQVAVRGGAQCMNSDLLSVDLPILSTYERDVRDTATHATVAYRDPMMLLAGEILRRQAYLARSSDQSPPLMVCIREPTKAEADVGAAQFAMFHNNNADITSWDNLPQQAPSNVWSSAAMHESRMEFSRAIIGAAYVGVSITHDGAMMFRRQECIVFRVRFTVAEDAPWLEVMSIPAGRHDEQDVYELVFLPFLRRLRSGVRFKRGVDFVDVVGSLFDVALDKMAAVSWLCIKGISGAQFTAAAAGTTDFREAPVVTDANGQKRLAWR
jgi:hypothetical protein